MKNLAKRKRIRVKFKILCIFYKITNQALRKKIKGKNNIINTAGAQLKNVQINLKGNNNKVILSPGAIMKNCYLKIKGSNNLIFIDENVRINLSGTLTCEDNNNQIIIGKKTTIESASLAAIEGTTLKVGMDCMISSSVYISTSDSHSILDSRTKERVNFAKSIAIGDHVWIGHSSKILKGINIGNNSVVGMGSIVTKNMGNGVIFTGIPAKLKRSNINWNRKRV